MDVGSCDQCVFWVRITPRSSQNIVWGHGSCHRFPPFEHEWPTTHEAGWCGEWKEVPRKVLEDKNRDD